MTRLEVDWDVTTTVASVVAVDEEGADDTGGGGVACGSGPTGPAAGYSGLRSR